ncbi:hypothetical protein JCM19233_1972 [Vibrio astriarenae]|nr:hypothetical protein JCM19233_1972 [Vibrio sp. C7]
MVGLVIAFIVLGVLGLYLAGAGYFLVLGGGLEGVTPYTFIEHVRYYHDHASYQKPLLLSGLVGMGIAYLVPLAVSGRR